MKACGHFAVALADGEGHEQLRVRVQGRVEISVADRVVALLVAVQVPLFLADERPDFVALDVPQTEVRQRFVQERPALIRRSGRTNRMIVSRWMPVSRSSTESSCLPTRAAEPESVFLASITLATDSPLSTAANPCTMQLSRLAFGRIRLDVCSRPGWIGVLPGFFLP